VKRRALMDFGDVGDVGAVYLYSDEWRLTARVVLPPTEIGVGCRLVHEGSEFEIFEIDDLGAFAAPPVLLPRRIRYPWMRVEIGDLIEDVVNTDELARWRESSGEFSEWFNSIDDVLPEGAADVVGWSLLDDGEADAVQRFLDRRDAIYAEIGDVPFPRYETHVAWAAVQEAAAAALVALGRST
jgi:hypothetical protein